MFFSISEAVFALAISEMKFFNIFKVDRVVPEFDFFALEISAATGAQFILTGLANKIFEKFTILAIWAQLRTAILTKVDLQTRKKPGET